MLVAACCSCRWRPVLPCDLSSRPRPPQAHVSRKLLYKLITCVRVSAPLPGTAAPASTTWRCRRSCAPPWCGACSWCVGRLIGWCGVAGQLGCCSVDVFVKSASNAGLLCCSGLGRPCIQPLLAGGGRSKQKASGHPARTLHPYCLLHISSRSPAPTSPCLLPAGPVLQHPLPGRVWPGAPGGRGEEGARRASAAAACRLLRLPRRCAAAALHGCCCCCCQCCRQLDRTSTPFETRTPSPTPAPDHCTPHPCCRLLHHAGHPLCQQCGGRRELHRHGALGGCAVGSRRPSSGPWRSSRQQRQAAGDSCCAVGSMLAPRAPPRPSMF